VLKISSGDSSGKTDVLRDSVASEVDGSGAVELELFAVLSAILLGKILKLANPLLKINMSGFIVLLVLTGL
jgi:hypothetical protein